jgi:hypothetical protein
MAGFAKPEIRLAQTPGTQTPGWFDQLAGLLSRELAPSSRKLRTALRLATMGTIGAGLIASAHVNNELGTYIVWLLVGGRVSDRRSVHACCSGRDGGDSVGVAVADAPVPLRLGLVHDLPGNDS